VDLKVYTLKDLMAQLCEPSWYSATLNMWFVSLARSPWLLYLWPLRFAQYFILAEQIKIPLSDVKEHKKVLKKVSVDFCNEQTEQVKNIKLKWRLIEINGTLSR
jgi:hypothetical protein